VVEFALLEVVQEVVFVNDGGEVWHPEELDLAEGGTIWMEDWS